MNKRAYLDGYMTKQAYLGDHRIIQDNGTDANVMDIRNTLGTGRFSEANTVHSKLDSQGRQLQDIGEDADRAASASRIGANISRDIRANQPTRDEQFYGDALTGAGAGGSLGAIIALLLTNKPENKLRNAVLGAGGGAVAGAGAGMLKNYASMELA